MSRPPSPPSDSGNAPGTDAYLSDGEDATSEAPTRVKNFLRVFSKYSRFVLLGKKLSDGKSRSTMLDVVACDAFAIIGYDPATSSANTGLLEPNTPVLIEPLSGIDFLWLFLGLLDVRDLESKKSKESEGTPHEFFQWPDFVNYDIDILSPREKAETLALLRRGFLLVVGFILGGLRAISRTAEFLLSPFFVWPEFAKNETFEQSPLKVTAGIAYMLTLGLLYRILLVSWQAVEALGSKIFTWPDFAEKETFKDSPFKVTAGFIFASLRAIYRLAMIPANLFINGLKLVTELFPGLMEVYCAKRLTDLDNWKASGFRENLGKYVGIAFFSLFLVIGSVWHSVGRAITSPVNSARRAWQVGERMKNKLLGGFLAAVSLCITGFTYLALLPQGIVFLATKLPSYIATSAVSKWVLAALDKMQKIPLFRGGILTWLGAGISAFIFAATGLSVRRYNNNKEGPRSKEAIKTSSPRHAVTPSRTQSPTFVAAASSAEGQASTYKALQAALPAAIAEGAPPIPQGGSIKPASPPPALEPRVTNAEEGDDDQQRSEERLGHSPPSSLRR